MHEQKRHILIGQPINEFSSYIWVRFDNKVTAQQLNATLDVDKIFSASLPDRKSFLCMNRKGTF